MKNYYYYEVLGVSTYASQEDIKKAYKEQMKKYHPDAHPEDNTNYYEQKAKLLNEAYEVLGNKDKRRDYDVKCAVREATKAKKQYERAERARQQARTAQQNTNTQYRGQSQNSTRSRKNTRQRKTKESDTFFGNVKKAYKEVRTEEKNHKFTERHTNINYNYYDWFSDKVHGVGSYALFRTGQGVVHVSAEMLYQIAKLRHITKDSVVKYVIRNRRLAAATIAGIMIFSNLPTNSNTPTTSPDKDDLAGRDTRVVQPIEENTTTLMRTYTVQPGDSLSSLSDMSLTKIKDIKKVNNLTSDTLYLGNTILIPYEVTDDNLQYYIKTVDSNGMSLEDLATIYSTDVDTLSRLNKEALGTVNGVKVIISSKVIVPNFITSNELEEIKDSIKVKTY